MGIIWVVPHRFMAFVVGCAFVLTACSPAVYKKPSEDFRNMTISLKQAYFIELDLSNRSRIERQDFEDQVAIWKSKVKVAPEELRSISKRMTERRQKDLHGELKPLREKAFAAIEGYAGILVSLASDEQTEAIVTEVNGLVQEIKGTVETANRLAAVAGQSQNIAGFTGPLTQYVGVLTEVIRLISDMVRERAIVKTIVKANGPIIELLKVLRGEAMAARENTSSQMKTIRETLLPFMQDGGSTSSDNRFRADIAKRVAEISSFEKEIVKDNSDIGKAFDDTSKAQETLFLKALLGDQEDWVARIQEFRSRVKATRDALEIIKADR